MNKFFKHLKQPYPKSSQNWPTVFVISFFVFLFLAVYQPFGLNLADQPTVLLVSSYFSGISFLVLFIHLIIIESFFKKLFREDKWTLGKELLWLSWVIISIALANALFDVIYNSNWSLTFPLIFSYLKYTLAVALFPIIVMIATRQHLLFRKYRNVALTIENSRDSSLGIVKSPDLIVLKHANQRNSYEFELNEVMYLESRGNYVNVIYFDGENIKNTLIRNTITKILDYLDFDKIIRCHRAYIINLNFVNKIEGNAQGLKLYLSNSEKVIPVSRKFVDTVRKKFGSGK
jgi:hypothetical protein